MTDVNEPDLDGLLEQLEAEEQHISATRRRLHDRIAMSPGSASRADVEQRERDLSAERRELHRRIDELRARRNELRARRTAG
jgi:chromosome segregation ATPase